MTARVLARQGVAAGGGEQGVAGGKGEIAAGGKGAGAVQDFLVPIGVVAACP